ncbi:hypothetical protein BDF14DRAFT_1849306 [Spinellus fusiger]|nr:hypothetical protein BDF14DRAFT_1849306 [Spinellus fusiger]
MPEMPVDTSYKEAMRSSHSTPQENLNALSLEDSLLSDGDFSTDMTIATTASEESNADAFESVSKESGAFNSDLCDVSLQEENGNGPYTNSTHQDTALTSTTTDFIKNVFKYNVFPYEQLLYGNLSNIVRDNVHGRQVAVSDDESSYYSASESEFRQIPGTIVGGVLQEDKAGTLSHYYITHNNSMPVYHIIEYFVFIVVDLNHLSPYLDSLRLEFEKERAEMIETIRQNYEEQMKTLCDKYEKQAKHFLEANEQ